MNEPEPNHVESCGCIFDGVTGLPIGPCAEHAPKSERITDEVEKYDLDRGDA